MARKPGRLEVLARLHEQLEETLARLIASQQTVQSGAVHSEARQEHPKDTRSIEAGYLSRGLAERVETMQDALRTLKVFRPPPREKDDPIGLGALIVVADEEGEESLYFLAPVGGGEKLRVKGVEVVVLTPRAALGGALVGRYAGDEVELDTPRGKRTLEIRSIG